MLVCTLKIRILPVYLCFLKFALGVPDDGTDEQKHVTYCCTVQHKSVLFDGKFGCV
jgi:hypothetical protein